MGTIYENVHYKTFQYCPWVDMQEGGDKFPHAHAMQTITGGRLMAGCGKLDNNDRVVSGATLPCGTRLSYGTGKETKRTIVHLCKECEDKEKLCGIQN